jgi:hypothetical protein
MKTKKVSILAYTVSCKVEDRIRMGKLLIEGQKPAFLELHKNIAGQYEAKHS